MKKAWEKSEDDACRLYDGVKTPASGSKAHSKLDVIIQSGALQGYRMEVKQSDSGSFSVSKKLFTKIRKQAAVTGNKALLRVDLGGDVFICMRECDFLEVI